MYIKGTALTILNDLMYCQRNQIRVIFLEVADRVGYCDKTVRSHIQQLNQLGLIETRRAKGPGPRKIVTVTREGRNALEQWRQ